MEDKELIEMLKIIEHSIQGGLLNKTIINGIKPSSVKWALDEAIKRLESNFYD